MTTANRLGTREGYGRHYNWARGVVGKIADEMVTPDYLKQSENLLGFPVRAMGAVRGGYQEPQNSPIDFEPTTLAKLVPRAGENRIVVHTRGSGTGHIYAITPGTSGRAEFTAPAGYTITEADMSKTTLNNTLFLTAQSDTQKPLMFHRDGAGTYQLDNTTLAPPVDTNTAAIAAAAAGVDEGYHWWRIRYLYRNGSSVAGPVFPTGGRNVTAGNRQVNIGNLTAGVGNTAVRARQDYLGWTLERTKLSVIANAQFTGTLGASAVPTATARWYTVEALGTANTTTDTRLDADLWDATDDGLFGAPPHLEGLIRYKDRLIGWADSKLYASQAVADAGGSGPCNWDAENEYPIGGESGDAIVTVVEQGDRLLVWKGNSIHVFEGDSPENYRTFELAVGLGAVGHRAVVVAGGAAYGWGPSGLVRVTNRAEHFGLVEAGHWIEAANTARLRQVCATRYRAELVMFAYSAGEDDQNLDVVVFDARIRQFRHFKNIGFRDALVQEDDAQDFDAAPLLFVDEDATGNAGSVVSLEPSFMAYVDASLVPRQAIIQKVNHDGTRLWNSPNGIVAGAAGTGTPPETHDVCVASHPDGGCYVVASELRFGAAADTSVIAQRFDKDGNKLWGATGVVVAFATGVEYRAKVALAPDGGCLISWTNAGAPPRVFVTRLDPAGARFAGWPASGGVQVSLLGSGDTDPSYPLVDANHFFLSWRSNSRGAVVHKFNLADGTDAAGWTAGGLAFTASTPVVLSPRGMYPLCLDGAGGVFVGAETPSNVVQVKRISGGAVLWTTADLETVDTGVEAVSVISDGAGGCYVCWSCGLATTYVRLQRVDSAGTAAWVSPTQVATGSQTYPYLSMVQDGVGGVLIAWSLNVDPLIGAQRVNSLGVAQWAPTATGIEVRRIGSTNARNPVVCTDGDSGLVIAWEDERGGVSQDDIFAQRVSKNGVLLWAANGADIGTGVNSQGTGAGGPGGLSIAFSGAADGTIPEGSLTRYHLWAAFRGTLDRVLHDGTGGVPITIRVATPHIDDGRPETYKVLERLHIDAEGQTASLNVAVTVDGGRDGLSTVSTSIEVEGFDLVWGDDTEDIAGNDLVWASDDGSVGGEWAGDENTFVPPIGLPHGTRGLSYSLEITGDLTEPLTLKGFVMDGIEEPERQLS